MKITKKDYENRFLNKTQEMYVLSGNGGLMTSKLDDQTNKESQQEFDAREFNGKFIRKKMSIAWFAGKTFNAIFKFKPHTIYKVLVRPIKKEFNTYQEDKYLLVKILEKDAECKNLEIMRTNSTLTYTLHDNVLGNFIYLRNSTFSGSIKWLNKNIHASITCYKSEIKNAGERIYDLRSFLNNQEEFDKKVKAYAFDFINNYRVEAKEKSKKSKKQIFINSAIINHIDMEEDQNYTIGIKDGAEIFCEQIFVYGNLNDGFGEVEEDY